MPSSPVTIDPVSRFPGGAARLVDLRSVVTDLPGCDVVFLSVMPVPSVVHLGPDLTAAAREVGGVVAFDPFDVAGHAAMRLVLVPYGGSECARHQRQVTAAAVSLAEYAPRMWGARVLGLGSLVVPITRGGRTVADAADAAGLRVSVDHGGAGDVAALLDGVLEVVGNRVAPRILVAGPTVMGAGLTRMLLAWGQPVTLWGLAGQRATLHSFAASLGRPHPGLTLSSEPADVGDHGVVVVATSAVAFTPDRFRPGSVVFDAAVPPGTVDSPEWAARGICRVTDAGRVLAAGAGFDPGQWRLTGPGWYGCAAGVALWGMELAAAPPPRPGLHRVGPVHTWYAERVLSGFTGLGWRHVPVGAPAAAGW